MRLNPLFALAGSLALGEAVALACPGPCGFWIVALALTVLAILFGYGLSLPGWGFGATALLGLSVAWAALAGRTNELKAISLRNQPYVCAVTLTEEPRITDAWCSCDVRADGLDLRVIFPKGERLPHVGDRWRFAGWLERKGPTDFARRKLWVKGAGTSADCLRPATRFSPAAVRIRLRRELSRRLGIGLDHAPDVANLNRAILLGERGRMDRSTRDAFAAAGTLHVFAISGLHVMCVAGVLFYALVLCGVPVRVVAYPLVPILWLYVWLVGAAPSAVRAAAMASLCFFAPAFWRKSDALVAWSLVFLTVHLVHPLQLAHVGSCLSFAVMLMLILFGRWYREVVPSRRGEALAISFAAWAAGVPIVAVVFGRFTPGAVLANLLLLPTAGVSVVASTLGLAAGVLSESLAGYFNNAAALATSAMVGVSRLTAALPGASREVAPWTLPHCAAWYAVLLLLLYLIRSVVLRRRRTL